MVPGGDLEFDGRAAVAAEIQSTSINMILVPGEGIEPTRCHHHRILSPARLPVPPSGHARSSSISDWRQVVLGIKCSARISISTFPENLSPNDPPRNAPPAGC